MPTSSGQSFYMSLLSFFEIKVSNQISLQVSEMPSCPCSIFPLDSAVNFTACFIKIEAIKQEFAQLPTFQLPHDPCVRPHPALISHYRGESALCLSGDSILSSLLRGLIQSTDDPFLLLLHKVILIST